MSSDAATILSTISKLACEGYYILTDHATEQRVKRRMTIADVEDILCNPTRLIRTDVEDGSKRHKIEGGDKNQRLAVAIMNDKLIVVITAMD